MKRFKSILFSSFLLVSISAIANKGAVYQATPVNEDVMANLAIPQWEVHVLGGIGNIDADIDEISQSNSGSWNAWTINAGIGYIFPLFNAEIYSDEVQWITAVMPQLNAYYFQGDINGEHEDDNNNTTDFSTRRLMVDTSLTFMSWRMLSIYALGGIGVSWNVFDFDTRLSNCLDEICLDGEDTNFAWEVGAGIHFVLTENIGISLQYLFSQINGIELENDSDNDINTNVTNFNVNSQEFMVGWRYVF